LIGCAALAALALVLAAPQAGAADIMAEWATGEAAAGTALKPVTARRQDHRAADPRRHEGELRSPSALRRNGPQPQEAP